MPIIFINLVTAWWNGSHKCLRLAAEKNRSPNRRQSYLYEPQATETQKLSIYFINLIKIMQPIFQKKVLNFEHVESLFCIVTTGHKLYRFGRVWYRWDGHYWIFVIKIISDQWRPLFMVVLTGSFLLIFFYKVHFAYNHLKCLSKKGFRMSKKCWVQSFNIP